MRPPLRDVLPQLIGVLALAAVAIGFGIAVRDNPDLSGFIAQFGYPGVFVASIIAGFNLLVPIPIVTFIPAFLSAGMHPAVVVVLITIGTTLSDGAAFVIGSVARRFALNSRQQRIKQMLERLHARHPLAPILAMYCYASILPLPNELAVIPLAVLGFRPAPVMAAVFFGNLTFNVIMTLVALQIL